MIKTITKCSTVLLAALFIAGCRNVICLIPSDICPTQYSTYFNVCGPRGPQYNCEDARMEALYKAYERKREKKVVKGLGGSAHKRDAY